MTASLLSTVPALLASQALLPYLGDTRFALFFACVLLAAALAGPVTAVATLLLSLVLAERFMFTGAGDVVRMLSRDVVLSLIALSLILLVDRVHRLRARAERHAERSAALADELRQQAGALEARATESEVLMAELEQLNVDLAHQTDVSNRAAVRSERLQRVLSRLLDRISPVAVAGVIVDEGRRSVDAKAAVVVVRGEGGAVEVLAAQGYAPHIVRNDSPAFDGPTPIGDVLRTGEAVWIPSSAEALRRYPGMIAYARPDSRAWVALPLAVEDRLFGALGFSFSAEGDFADEDRAFMILLAQQCAQALDRARLYQLELEARVRAEFAERRLTLLSEASARLGESLDYLTTLNNVAWLAVPEIADWCSIHLVGENGEPQIVALAHPDPQRLEARVALEKLYPSSRSSGAPYTNVLQTGQPVHIPVVVDADVRAAARDERHYQGLRSLGLRSQIAVPITADDGVCGVLTLAHAESGRSFTDADVTLALELGRRAGTAVQNARLYASVQHANVTKADFLAVMSHELRTPLNAIIGYSDLLLLGVPHPISEHAHRQVQRIRGASTSLLQIVEEILSFSRVEAGKEELRISPLDVGAVVADCVAMVQPLAAEKELAARFIEPPEPVRMVSDERKIRQIVTNLLSNAVKFTDVGELTAEVRQLPKSVQVLVSDTGIGIPAEHHERIFEAFWQVESASTRRFGGTGLGLGVARKLALLLEGQLTVESEPGRGSTFTLTLPLGTPGLGR
ncbi:MAG TPA: ATP-binding protein [Longimicrobiales bacterium]|nr:ATP-binding protein [Longimicrobiales bacterium]